MEEVAEIITHPNKHWKHWHYKNTALLILSLVVFFFLAETPFVQQAIRFIGNFGYIGAFIAGILFVSVFTIAPASVVLFYLAEDLNPLGVAIAGGLGGMVGDFLILKYFKDKVFEELRPFYMEHGGKPIRKLFRTPYFAWALPLIGALLIIAPIPDEVGVGLMGLSKMKTVHFLLLMFLLDVIGVLIVVTAARSI